MVDDLSCLAVIRGLLRVREFEQQLPDANTLCARVVKRLNIRPSLLERVGYAGGVAGSIHIRA